RRHTRSKRDWSSDVCSSDLFLVLLLDQYGTDLTALAKKGIIDPVIGRDKEIARVIEILNRRTKNNPVLIGEAGVGKTAVVEGLRSEERRVGTEYRHQRLTQH